jgi:hypothetical protein
MKVGLKFLPLPEDVVLTIEESSRYHKGLILMLRERFYQPMMAAEVISTYA